MKQHRCCSRRKEQLSALRRRGRAFSDRCFGRCAWKWRGMEDCQCKFKGVVLSCLSSVQSALMPEINLSFVCTKKKFKYFYRRLIHSLAKNRSASLATYGELFSSRVCVKCYTDSLRSSPPVVVDPACSRQRSLCTTIVSRTLLS